MTGGPESEPAETSEAGEEATATESDSAPEEIVSMEALEPNRPDVLEFSRRDKDDGPMPRLHEEEE